MGRRLREEVMHWGSPASNTKTDAPHPTQQMTFLTHYSPSLGFFFFCNLPSLLTHEVSKPPSRRDLQRPRIFSMAAEKTFKPPPQKKRHTCGPTGLTCLIPRSPKGFRITFLLNESKCYRANKSASQTASRLKSGLMWLVLCYHSGGVRANRLQRNRWQRWVIGPHAQRHQCTENCHCMRPQSLARLGICLLERWASLLWFWKKWTCTLG